MEGVKAYVYRNNLEWSRGYDRKSLAQFPYCYHGNEWTGKSVRIADIEKHILAENGTIVVLDVNGTHLAL